MDPFSIAALIAMVVGAGVQYQTQQDAIGERNRQIQQSMQNQRNLQMQAEKKAIDTAQTFEAPERAQQQSEIEQQIEQSLMDPVSESQAIRAKQSTTQGDVSSDYTMAKAASDAAVMKDAHTLAKLMSKTTGANRLRMNEGLRMMDASMDIDRFGSFSRGQSGADQIAIGASGVPDAGMMAIGGALQGIGSMGASGGFGGTTAAQAGSAWTPVTNPNKVGFAGAGRY